MHRKQHVVALRLTHHLLEPLTIASVETPSGTQCDYFPTGLLHAGEDLLLVASKKISGLMPTGLCLFVVRMNIIMPGLPTLHLKIGAHKGVTEIETTPPVPHSVTVGKWSSSSFEVFTQQQLGDISRVAISICPPGSSSTPCLNLPPVTALHAANVSRSSASDTALVSGGQVTAAPLTAQAPHNTPLQKVVEQCILI